MEKRFVWLFVFVFAIGLVCAASGWGDINDGNDSDDVPASVMNDSGDVDSEQDKTVDPIGDYVAPDYSSEESGGKYTDNFYIALGLGGFGFLIVIYFIYLFFKKPKNRWKSKK
jgi:hypothetical protein